MFVVVYAPALAAVAVLRSSVQVEIPLIILVSAGLAALIMALRAGGRKGIGELRLASS